MLYLELKEQIENKGFLHPINEESLNFEEYSISTYDTDGFNYEIVGIEIDIQTRRIVLRIKDGILTKPITDVDLEFDAVNVEWRRNHE